VGGLGRERLGGPVTARRIELETADQFVGEVVGTDDALTFLNASATAARLAREWSIPRGRISLRYEPGHRLPVVGGGTATAAALGLPLIEGDR
jgi:hypothetical protein